MSHAPVGLGHHVVAHGPPPVDGDPRSQVGTVGTGLLSLGPHTVVHQQIAPPRLEDDAKVGRNPERRPAGRGLVWPWELPRSCPDGNRSRASTRAPRRASCQAAAVPMPPAPTTITSNLCMVPPPTATGSTSIPGVGDGVRGLTEGVFRRIVSRCGRRKHVRPPIRIERPSGDGSLAVERRWAFRASRPP